MQTKILTLIVLNLLFLNLYGQEDPFAGDKVAQLPDSDRKLRMGLHFSPALSWFKPHTDGYEHNGNKFGFSYGLTADFFLTPNTLISSGVDLLYAGGDLKYEGTTLGLNSTYEATTEQTFNLRYVELPLTLKLKTNEIGYLSYFGQFGLKTGINYRSNANYSFTYRDENQNLSVHNVKINDVSEQVNLFNVSMVIGAGVEYHISGNTTLYTGLIFNNGFISQMDNNEHVIGDDGKALLDGNNNPVYSDEDIRANLNYLLLTFGIYF